MKILYDNLVKSATINSLTENPEYAFTALKDSRLSRVARTVDDANQAIDFDLGSIKDAEYCAITKHNISESATVKLQAFENNPLVDSRVLEYKFEDNVLDTSGNGNDGTPTDITYAAGVFGQAAVFNGTSSRIVYDFVDITYPVTTICFWFKMSSSAQQCMFDTRLTSGDGGEGYYNTAPLWKIDNLSGLRKISDYADGNWHFASIELLNIALKKLSIGASFASTFRITASIDEFRIHNRVLTQEEITGYYETNAPYPDYEIDMEFQGDWILSNFSESYRYWRLAIDDDNSDGYIQLGYAFLGTSLTMPGMNRSVIIPQKSNSVATKSMSGQLYGDRRLKYKSAEISCEAVTETERQEIRTFFDYVDVTLPFVLMIWEDDLNVEPPIYCSLTDELSWNKLDINGLLWSLSFKFEECF